MKARGLRLAATISAALAALLSFGAPGRAYPAQAGIVGVPEFDPPSFTPGQAVTVYALLDPAGFPWTVESLSSGFPEPASDDSPGLISASLRARSGMPLISIRFAAWRPGPGTLPPVTVGGLTSPAIRFSCASALADGNDSPPEMVGQLEPDGFRLKLYLAGGAALFACVGIAVAAVKLIPAIREMGRRRAFAAARAAFDRTLATLASANGEPEDWAALCSGLRRFVGLRARTDWAALTSGEVASLPKDSVPGEVQPEASTVLAMGDRARFSGAVEDFRLALRSAAEIGSRIDDALAAAAEATR